MLGKRIVCEQTFEWQLLNRSIYLWLFTVRVYTVDVEFDEFNLTAVRNRCQLDDCVERNFQVRQFTCWLIEEIGEHTPKNCLMRYDENVSLSFQLHHHRLKSNHNVFVRLSTRIAISEFVRIASLEVFGEFALNFFVRHLLANALQIRVDV